MQQLDRQTHCETNWCLSFCVQFACSQWHWYLCKNVRRKKVIRKINIGVNYRQLKILSTVMKCPTSGHRLCSTMAVLSRCRWPHLLIFPTFCLLGPKSALCPLSADSAFSFWGGSPMRCRVFVEWLFGFFYEQPLLNRSGGLWHLICYFWINHYMDLVRLVCTEYYAVFIVSIWGEKTHRLSQKDINLPSVAEFAVQQLDTWDIKMWILHSCILFGTL